MKVLVDTNIILDVLLDREPFVENAIQFFELIETGEIQGFIAATTITNIFYILRKLLGREPTNELDAILTRNKSDFADVSLPIFSAAELTAHLQRASENQID